VFLSGKNPKPLSGIETIHLFDRLLGGAGKTLNPYQGLKLFLYWRRRLDLRGKNPKPLSGIETSSANTLPSGTMSGKNPKSLSGIETSTPKANYFQNPLREKP